MARKMIDCRQIPNEIGCTLTVAGEEDEVLDAAVALGARAVLLGRPFAWGLALAGETGVRQVIADVLGEFDLTLGLTGHTAVDQLSPEVLTRRN